MTKTIDRQLPLKRRQKVVASLDLPGVPEGTEGQVKVANGITWYRYWVDFANGITLGSVSHEQLAQKNDWPQFKIDRENDALNAETKAGEEAAAEPASDGAASGNTSGVPEHLLERSRAARARLGA
jgi:hypothetical protein